MADTLEPADARGDQLLAACLQKLIEHFDSARIIVTSHEENRSEMRSVGAGNLFAQVGSVEAWLDRVGENEPKDDDEPC
jgi:hypothetical protein